MYIPEKASYQRVTLLFWLSDHGSASAENDSDSNSEASAGEEASATGAAWV